ncbi:MAG: hypothetical protein M3312_06125 [Actinomycetota bacterium]|nr:hypothetical protein [Actinomycetota bacterium]
MGVWDKLRNTGTYVRKRWPSKNPESYYQYKAGRERQRRQAEQTSERAERSGELAREGAERGREYEERYMAERAAEEPRTEAPPRDTS